MKQIPPVIQTPTVAVEDDLLLHDGTQFVPTPSAGFVTTDRLSTYLRVFRPLQPLRWYENRARNGANTRLLIGTGGAPALSGTISSSTLSASGILQTWTTAASAGAIAGGLMSDSEGYILRGAHPRVLTRIVASASTTDLRIFVGFCDTALGAADDPAAVATVFRYSTAASDPGWVCVTRSASLTVSSSVRAYTASETLLLGIDYEDSAVARFWMGTSEDDIDIVHEATASLPNAASAMGSVVGVGAVAASARAIQYDRSVWMMP